MCHSTYKQVNYGDFQLLIVESQIDSLIFDPFLSYNLCKYLNISWNTF